MNARPILHRPAQGSLEIELPRHRDQRDTLRAILPGRHLAHGQDDGHNDWLWRIARPLFWTAAFALCRHYGRVTVIDDGRTLARCTVACRAARKKDCECVCGGTNHGVDGGLWREVGDQLLVAAIAQHTRFTLTLDAELDVKVTLDQ